MPATLEICRRPFNDGLCLGIVYRPQPETLICSRCSGNDPGAIYTRTPDTVTPG